LEVETMAPAVSSSQARFSSRTSTDLCRLRIALLFPVLARSTPEAWNDNRAGLATLL
jgi:hypothetical protein